MGRYSHSAHLGSTIVDLECYHNHSNHLATGYNNNYREEVLKERTCDIYCDCVYTTYLYVRRWPTDPLGALSTK